MQSDYVDRYMRSAPIDRRLLHYLLSNYGLRISEILNLEHSDIVSDYQLLLRGTKNSAARYIIVPDEYSVYLRACVQHKWKPCNFNYHSVWRMYNRLGVRDQRSNKSRYKRVTHSYRAKIIQQFVRNKIEPRAIADAIGHRSVKSQRYYY